MAQVVKKQTEPTAFAGWELYETNNGVITRKQAAIWVTITLILITVASVYALYAIDDIKSRDTILYAKFLANLKDR